MGISTTLNFSFCILTSISGTLRYLKIFSWSHLVRSNEVWPYFQPNYPNFDLDVGRNATNCILVLSTFQSTRTRLLLILSCNSYGYKKWQCQVLFRIFLYNYVEFILYLVNYLLHVTLISDFLKIMLRLNVILKKDLEYCTSILEIQHSIWLARLVTQENINGTYRTLVLGVIDKSADCCLLQNGEYPTASSHAVWYIDLPLWKAFIFFFIYMYQYASVETNCCYKCACSRLIKHINVYVLG